MADDNDPTENQILNELAGWARGFDVYGRRLPAEQQAAAMLKYADMMDKRRMRGVQKQQAEAEVLRVQAEIERTRAEAVRTTAEAAKTNTQAEVELQRLQLEAERLQIEKARVFVEALDVLGKSGLAPEQLLSVVQDMGTKLLGGPSASDAASTQAATLLPALQLIEDKRKS